MSNNQETYKLLIQFVDRFLIPLINENTVKQIRTVQKWKCFKTLFKDNIQSNKSLIQQYLKQNSSTSSKVQQGFSYHVGEQSSLNKNLSVIKQKNIFIDAKNDSKLYQDYKYKDSIWKNNSQFSEKSSINKHSTCEQNAKQSINKILSSFQKICNVFDNSQMNKIKEKQNSLIKNNSKLHGYSQFRKQPTMI